MDKVNEEKIRYGLAASWARELGLDSEIVAARLSEIEGITGKRNDGTVVENGFYAENDVRLVLSDLLTEK